ncbi:MAG: hypothetical protein A2X25_03750 [Chloroflexi bacterium GWB2_49_20]|nr:MAG: hypothetical protein A2X25_03750 [Chloroflexi bacterium GWB2_49_20]OGN76701.1 MAG: hypothetical protein A2X26_10840 [Chloroflexi bacterium GWC2_49_37]OGN83661.1 MAG: hypothetical protein A2X27_01495 [Chloroflexi bacterium GWD2_49_16]HBG74217.1 hypothetical protein [Anaerolineae bacterium]HCC78966.1 hypothetical protein [Anaerolineae bacterium]
MKLVIDISYYNRLSSGQWDLLATVLDGVIIRLSYGLSQDTMAQKHINNAKRVGLPFAGYHWVDPTRDLNSQVGLYKTTVEKYRPASMFNDYEQYWTDWAAYMRQDLATAYASRFSSTQLNSYFTKFHNASKSKLNIPIGSYSADWFIRKYSPALGSWMTKSNYWEARYLRYYNAAWWTAKQKELGKDFDIKKIKEIAKQAQIVNGIGRQFESYIQVKGLSENIGYHLDWNVFTDEGFYQMFGVDPKDEEEPTPVEPDVYVVVSEKVGSQALRLRAQPNTMAAVLAGEVAGTKLKIMEDTQLAKPKIGVIGQWLDVMDPQSQQGFVAAWFVDLVPSEVPQPPPSSPPAELFVAVTPEVGTLGLRLRSQPNTTSATLAGEAVGTKLKVLEPIDKAATKIGIDGQWLNVSDPKGMVGYVAARYVAKVDQPEPVIEPPPEAVSPPGLIEQKYKVVASAIWIRDKPDGNKIGYLWKNEIITVTEIADKWAYFGKGWVPMTYLVPV